MRPGRPGRCAHREARLRGRHGLTPPERHRPVRGSTSRRDSPGVLHAARRTCSDCTAPTSASPSSGGGRAKAARGALASASTAEKNAALLAAADLLEERAGDLLAANARRRRGGRGRRAWRPVRSTACASPTPASRAWPTASRRRRAARPGRRGARRLAPAQRAEDRARPGAARRGRDHLREPAQRHQRRRRHLPEVGQRRPPARLGERAALQPRHRRRRCATGSPRPGLPADAVLLVDDVRHEAAVELMQLTDVVDCLIPRGGPALIQSIRDHATVPVIIDGDGNCHVYVDASADLDSALDIVVNAKTQRPSVCNAAESLVVHESVADAFLPACRDRAGRAGRRARRRRRRPGAGARRWARPPTTTSAASSSPSR